MTKEERQHWIDRWNSLKPSPKRDMIIKMWGGKPNTKERTDQDKAHLQWIHDRIVNVYGESENVDFLIKMRDIIDNL
jgi:hypothetical protein